MMWGIIPAAGRGTRMQPLGFSKELLPLGSRDAGGAERPIAVSEYLVERMVLGGAEKICFVIAPGKTDILHYFGGRHSEAEIFYAVQPEPQGLCDSLFRCVGVLDQDDDVLIGLPDTVWFPTTAYRDLPTCRLGFILFPVQRPELFDAVVTDERDRVVEIQVKSSRPKSHWVWGAIKLKAATFRELHQLWLARDRSDEYLGTLVNAYIEAGGQAFGFKIGTTYADVGTPTGYRDAARALTIRPPFAQPDIPAAEGLGIVERHDTC
jgi:glucose-1-phosphate thymidylyltransferase